MAVETFFLLVVALTIMFASLLSSDLTISTPWLISAIIQAVLYIGSILIRRVAKLAVLGILFRRQSGITIWATNRPNAIATISFDTIRATSPDIRRFTIFLSIDHAISTPRLISAIILTVLYIGGTLIRIVTNLAVFGVRFRRSGIAVRATNRPNAIATISFDTIRATLPDIGRLTIFSELDLAIATDRGWETLTQFLVADVRRGTVGVSFTAFTVLLHAIATKRTFFFGARRTALIRMGLKGASRVASLGPIFRAIATTG